MFIAVLILGKLLNSLLLYSILINVLYKISAFTKASKEKKILSCYHQTTEICLNQLHDKGLKANLILLFFLKPNCYVEV